MPRGVYLHLDTLDGSPLAQERFSCAAGPQGWRYVADVLDIDDGVPIGGIDLTVDEAWRQLRVEVSSGGWVVRGGRSANEMSWVRGTDEGSAFAYAFAGRSPAFLIATARLLALSLGAATAIRVVDLTEPSLAPLPRERVWTLTDITSYGTGITQLPVERYEVMDRDTGELYVVHLTGDVVLDTAGVELTELDSPPTPAIG